MPPAGGSATGPASCERYVPLGGTGSLSYCPSNLFNQAATQECDGFIYDRTNSVVYEVSAASTFVFLRDLCQDEGFASITFNSGDMYLEALEAEVSRTVILQCLFLKWVLVS